MEVSRIGKSGSGSGSGSGREGGGHLLEEWQRLCDMLRTVLVDEEDQVVFAFEAAPLEQSNQSPRPSDELSLVVGLDLADQLKEVELLQEAVEVEQVGLQLAAVLAGMQPVVVGEEDVEEVGLAAAVQLLEVAHALSEASPPPQAEGKQRRVELPRSPLNWRSFWRLGIVDCELQALSELLFDCLRTGQAGEAVEVDGHQFVSSGLEWRLVDDFPDVFSEFGGADAGVGAFGVLGVDGHV